MSMVGKKVIVVGAGIGGLCAAAELSRLGANVTVLERQAGPGGKLWQVQAGGLTMDLGPSVLTMRPVFEGLFARAGQSLADYITVRAPPQLCRHFWPDMAPFDLFVDLERNVAAIGDAFGQKAAQSYRVYAQYCQTLYETACEPFIFAPKPSMLGALKHFGLRVMSAPKDMDATRTMYEALQTFFADVPKLQQLFMRYATYSGGSPFLAPATLNLIVHVERMGVWSVDGGLSMLAKAIEQLATKLGATFMYSQTVACVIKKRGRATGVTLDTGENLDADAVILNADVRAFERDELGGPGLNPINATQSDAGLSAVCWAMAAKPQPRESLALHNVVFAQGGSHEEFDAVFARNALPKSPTVYLCAQDRNGTDEAKTPERVFALINAPPTNTPMAAKELDACTTLMRRQLAKTGLSLNEVAPVATQTPHDFGQRFWGSHGALYGKPPHGWRSFLSRRGSSTSTAGLFLAGGSVHPGPGLPMAALSGMMGAWAVIDFLPSTTRSKMMATSGGMSMHAAMMADMR